jgi:hypothetical protein
MKYGTLQGDFFGTGEVDIGSSQDELWDKLRSLFGILEVIIVYLERWSYGRYWDDNKVFWKMKNDLTTGTWQDDIWCPINIILLCTSDGLISLLLVAGFRPLSGLLFKLLANAVLVMVLLVDYTYGLAKGALVAMISLLRTDHWTITG